MKETFVEFSQSQFIKLLLLLLLFYFIYLFIYFVDTFDKKSIATEKPIICKISDKIKSLLFCQMRFPFIIDFSVYYYQVSNVLSYFILNFKVSLF